MEMQWSQLGCGAVTLSGIHPYFTDKFDSSLESYVKAYLAAPIQLTRRDYGQQFKGTTLGEWLKYPYRVLTIFVRVNHAKDKDEQALEQLGFIKANTCDNPYETHPFQSKVCLWYLPGVTKEEHEQLMKKA